MKDRLANRFRNYLIKGKRDSIDLSISALLFFFGFVIVFMVFATPKTTDMKKGLYAGDYSPNVASIAAGRVLENGDAEGIENVIYNITLIPDEFSNDIRVSISTNLKQSKYTKYRITWPGEIRQHPFNAIALSTEPGVSTELLGVVEKYKGFRETSLEVASRDDNYYKHNDYFMFYWKNGKEEISFYDRRIRLHLIPITSSDIINVKFGLTEEISLINESPAASEILPNVRMGVIERKYFKVEEIIITYTERSLKRISDYLLIISGLLFGIGSSYFTNWLSSKINEYRVNANKAN